MKVYTRINGKLASWLVDLTDHRYCIEAVRVECGQQHRAPVLAVIQGGKAEQQEAA